MSHDTGVRSSLVTGIHHLLLVVVSVLLFPTSVLALFYNYAAQVLCPQNGLRRHIQQSPRFKPLKVFITGISTPAGLRTARALYATGHNVVGIGIGEYAFLNHARWSKAVSKFYSLMSPTSSENTSRLVEDFFRVLVKERATLWIDCSDGRYAQALSQVKDAVEERTSCVCLVPGVEQIRRFESRQGFRRLARELDIPSPESHSVKSRNDIFNVLNISNGKKYMLSSPNGTSEPQTRTLLPRRTVSQTYQDVARLKLSKATPWVLEEYTEGLPQYLACAIVVQGKVKAIASASVSPNGDSHAIPAKAGLNDALRLDMERFADAVGPNLSSHLTMEFCLEERATHAGVVQQVLPLNGQLVAHESLLLFEGKKGSINLTKAYTSILSTTTTELEVYTGLPYSDSTTEVAAPTEPDIGVYFLFKDLRGLVVGPTLKLLAFQTSISAVVRSWVVFLQHLVLWQEAVYEFGDPFPLFWYTHVYVPCQLISHLLQQIWSRLSKRWRQGVPERRELDKSLDG